MWCILSGCIKIYNIFENEVYLNDYYLKHINNLLSRQTMYVKPVFAVGISLILVAILKNIECNEIANGGKILGII